MTNGNDAAFVPEWQTGTQGMAHYPLTKREYFAATAMQGLTSNAKIVEAMATISTKYKDWPPEQLVAAFATEYADALIEALNKEQA